LEKQKTAPAASLASEYRVSPQDLLVRGSLTPADTLQSLLSGLNFNIYLISGVTPLSDPDNPTGDQMHPFSV
jgi:hypothetical protein